MREVSNRSHHLAGLWLPTELTEAILTHLRAAQPQEGVGLLAVEQAPRRGSYSSRRSFLHLSATRFYPGTNIDASPTRYTMAPAEVVAAFNDIEEHGWRLGAIVHSHPTSPATPSATDLREAAYPDALMVIVSFLRPQPEIRAWKYEVSSDPRGLMTPTEVHIEIASGIS